MLIDTRIPIKFILNKIKFEIVYVSIIGLAIHYITSLYKSAMPEIPISIPAFIGTAISVILSFKINQSYDRWWEARKVWGSIVNDSRSFVLQLQSFLPPESEKEIKIMVQRHVAWCYSLGQTLRGLDPMEGLNKYLSDTDLEYISKHANKPLAILQLNSRHIADLRQEGKLDSFQHIQINNSMVNFSNWMGMAERIRSTVFPVTYRLFLHVFIYIFVITLSISLRDMESVFEMPLLLVLSLSFFLLERSATHLQDPFMNRPTDTAMTTIARTIEINLKQLIGEKEIPEPIQPKTFYSM